MMNHFRFHHLFVYLLPTLESFILLHPLKNHHIYQAGDVLHFIIARWLFSNHNGCYGLFSLK